jgi:hypothetical protein
VEVVESGEGLVAVMIRYPSYLKYQSVSVGICRSGRRKQTCSLLSFFTETQKRHFSQRRIRVSFCIALRGMVDDGKVTTYVKHILHAPFLSADYCLA